MRSMSPTTFVVHRMDFPIWIATVVAEAFMAIEVDTHPIVNHESDESTPEGRDDLYIPLFMEVYAWYFR